MDRVSDDGSEDALYDGMAMRSFAGIDLFVGNVPDATPLLMFRGLRLEHDLTAQHVRRDWHLAVRTPADAPRATIAASHGLES